MSGVLVTQEQKIQAENLGEPKQTSVSFGMVSGNCKPV